MKRLNLGCGKDYRAGWINVELDKQFRADVRADISKPLPFKNNSVEEIFCKNVFERIPNPLNFLLELKRILKKGGRAIIVTSNASYFIYHFPRKKAYHDSYNLNRPLEDQHYFMFQRGHLVAFSKKAGLKIKKLEYYISNIDKGRDRNAQKIFGAIIGKKFGYSDFLWVVQK